MCEKAGWHDIEECEDTDELEARRFKKLKSDLFKTHGIDLPTRQKHSMIHNSNLPFLRLPPEIRRRIYALLLGGQNVWIGHEPGKRKLNLIGYDGEGNLMDKTRPEKWIYYKRERSHCGGSLYHSTGGDHDANANAKATLDLRLLRTCRSMYTEAALLPYWLNRFFFQDVAVRKRFEKSARAGKKRAQKLAVGKYEIMDRVEFEADGWHGQVTK